MHGNHPLRPAGGHIVDVPLDVYCNCQTAPNEVIPQIQLTVNQDGMVVVAGFS
jgi:hypothetical protein